MTGNLRLVAKAEPCGVCQTPTGFRTPAGFPVCAAHLKGDPVPNPLPVLYLWLGQPADGDEHLLMVLVDDPEGAVWRPLLAVTEADARGLALLAKQAADALDVPAVLRAYSIRTLDGVDAPLDTVGETTS